MNRKYKNAKPSYKKLDDNKKIDFLLSKIDKISDHANKMISNINKKDISKKINSPKTTIERMQTKGCIKISYSNKRLWEERIEIDKLFKGPEAVFEENLVELFSQKIILKQTLKAPQAYKEGKIIYVDFPKGIVNITNLVLRLFLDIFIDDYFEKLHKLLKIKWDETTKKKYVIDFIKKSNLILIKKDTSKEKYQILLKKILGLNTNEWYSRFLTFTWGQFLNRILQMGAMARRKKEHNVIEMVSIEILKNIESKLLTKLNNKI